MKIIVRSKYWGSHVHGQQYQPKRGTPHQPYKVLLAQIDFDQRWRRHKSHWGCCQRMGGRRVLELTESQFLDAHRGKWDLYRTNFTYDAKGNPTHDFFLLPDNQTSIDVKEAVKKDGWQFWGSCDACILRMDLEPLLRPFLQERKQMGRVVSHAHIFVMMDSAEDKFPPLQSTQARSTRKFHGKSAKHKGGMSYEDSSCCSVATSTTATTEDSSSQEFAYYDHPISTSNPVPFVEVVERASSPVRPPSHVQCIVEEPTHHQVGAMLDAMDLGQEPHVPTDAPTPSQFQEPAKKAVGGYLAALTGAPTSVDNYRAAAAATPAKQWGTPTPTPAWESSKEDFPVLVNSLNRMKVSDKHNSKANPASSALERVPAAA